MCAKLGPQLPEHMIFVTQYDEMNAAYHIMVADGGKSSPNMLYDGDGDFFLQQALKGGLCTTSSSQLHGASI